MLKLRLRLQTAPPQSQRPASLINQHIMTHPCGAFTQTSPQKGRLANPHQWRAGINHHRVTARRAGHVTAASQSAPARCCSARGAPSHTSSPHKSLMPDASAGGNNPLADGKRASGGPHRGQRLCRIAAKIIKAARKTDRRGLSGGARPLSGPTSRHKALSPRVFSDTKRV